jgi:hypothetical protein
MGVSKKIVLDGRAYGNARSCKSGGSVKISIISSIGDHRKLFDELLSYPEVRQVIRILVLVDGMKKR